MKTNTLGLLGLLGLATVALGGCHAEERKAEKRPVKPVQLQEFPLGSELQGDENNQSFQNNKAFFWKAPYNVSVGAMVMQAADQIDVNEDEGVAARSQLEVIMADHAKVVEAYLAAVEKLPEEERAPFVSLNDLYDERSTSLSEEEFAENIARSEAELITVEAKLAREAARALTREAAATLAELGRLMKDRARLGQTDPARDSLQEQIDKLSTALPELKGAVLEAKTQRETVLVTYEGHFRDKARRAELLKEIETLEKSIKAVPAGLVDAKKALDESFARKEGHFHKQYRIGRIGEDLVALVISNTEYFENLLKRVTFNFRGKDVGITMVDFPQKETTLSTENGSIRNVSYNPVGGVLRFDAVPDAHADFFRFKVTRTRIDVKDGRIFYQGEMNYCVAHSGCEGVNLLKRGVAKFVTSN